MMMTKSMSSADIRKVIREYASDALAFIASDPKLVHLFRLYQLEERKRQPNPEDETQHILEAASSYFKEGVRL